MIGFLGCPNTTLPPQSQAVAGQVDGWIRGCGWVEHLERWSLFFFRYGQKLEGRVARALETSRSLFLGLSFHSSVVLAVTVLGGS